MKRIIALLTAFLALLAYSFLFSLNVSAAGNGNDDINNTNNLITFDTDSKTMTLYTGLSIGSTAANRIRSIGWLAVITLPNGQTASAVFETNGSNGSSNGYSWSYSYVINQFTHDAGTTGQSIAESFYNTTGGTIKLYAYFAWWKAGRSSDPKYNFNGPADGKPGAVSGYFSNPNANYTPADVQFSKNPDSRFASAPGNNGVATTFDQAAQIEAKWGGNASSLQDYYPAVGILGGSVTKDGIGNQILGRVYRVNTDVITSVVVYNYTGSDILGTTVTFTVGGVTQQSKTVPIPANGSNLCWFRWHTPSTPGYVNISATVSGGGTSSVNNDNNYIYPCNEQTPPDPQGKDTNPGYAFVQPGTNGQTPSLAWGVWNYYITYDTGTNADGSPYSIPIVNWYYTSYSAQLTSALTITPSPSCPTAYKGGDGLWEMKSGYGIGEAVSSNVSTTDPSAVTSAQRVAGFYPEFQYGTYYRLFEKLSDGLFYLQSNKYSMLHYRVHYTPVWFPDGDYTAQTYTYDAWCPMGMLSSYSVDTVHISDSVYNDWYIKPSY